MIKVLVVEDSPTVQQVLCQILSSETDIQVIGRVNNGKAALEFVKKEKPDVITMDINMPVMNGLEATTEIMHTVPVPIIIVSANYHPDDLVSTFKAIKAGAVSVVEKPAGIDNESFRQYSRELIHNVRLMSEIRVIKRIGKNEHNEGARQDQLVEISSIAELKNNNVLKTIKNKWEIVVIGASTGGPAVIEKILSSIKPDFPLPIIIVQHMTSGFMTGFIDWLNSVSVLPVQLAKDRERFLKGRCYVAPDNHHLKLKADGTFRLSDEPPVNNMKPSISVLFQSAADQYGEKAVGILLTGMGKDGASELKRMKDAGAMTIIQNAQSSVVYGMPGEARKLNAADAEMDPESISRFFNENIKGQN